MRNPVKFKVKFEGDKKVNLGGIIFVPKAKKLIRKGHVVYLAHVVDTMDVVNYSIANSYRLVPITPPLKHLVKFLSFLSTGLTFGML